MTTWRGRSLEPVGVPQALDGGGPLVDLLNLVQHQHTATVPLGLMSRFLPRLNEPGSVPHTGQWNARVCRSGAPRLVDSRVVHGSVERDLFNRPQRLFDDRGLATLAGTEDGLDGSWRLCQALPENLDLCAFVLHGW